MTQIFSNLKIKHDTIITGWGPDQVILVIWQEAAKPDEPKPVNLEVGEFCDPPTHVSWIVGFPKNWGPCSESPDSELYEFWIYFGVNVLMDTAMVQTCRPILLVFTVGDWLAAILLEHIATSGSS